MAVFRLNEASSKVYIPIFPFLVRQIWLDFRTRHQYISGPLIKKREKRSTILIRGTLIFNAMHVDTMRKFYPVSTHSIIIEEHWTHNALKLKL